jgi:hypothetical protein
MQWSKYYSPTPVCDAFDQTIPQRLSMLHFLYKNKSLNHDYNQPSTQGPSRCELPVNPSPIPLSAALDDDGSTPNLPYVF